MRIVELVLDDNEESGIEAISIVESPAIESDFIALKSDEIKLAQVDSEKKILMGALLIPNKPIYRKNEGDEYYIYFSKDTVLKASQRYLTNGYQSNSTLEHSDNLQGLTLVESWIVEDEQYDKSRKYDLGQGKPISLQTIKRMYSYLSRAEAYYDPSDTKACGTISFLLWGGKSAKAWSLRKIKQLEKK